MSCCTRSTLLVLGLASLTGCRTGGIPLLNYLPLSKPVNAVIATDSPLESADALLRYEGLRKAMSKSIGREVHMELAFPLLLEPGLATGWQQIAIVSPTHYASLGDAARFEVLAHGSATGSGAQPALLITRADSGLSSVADLRDKRVAFGPQESARMSAAAMFLLEESGVRASDLKRQLLPVPGSLMHLAGSEATARAVLNKDADAAVVDEAYFAALPESGGAGDGSQNAKDDPSQNQFRVLGKTMVLPDRLIVSSAKLDAATAARIRAFLVEADNTHAAALESVRIRGFEAPTAEVIDNLRRLRGKAGTTPAATAHSSDAANGPAEPPQPTTRS